MKEYYILAFILSGCNLFQSARIDKTCEDVSGCGQDSVLDTGSPPVVGVALGVAEGEQVTLVAEGGLDRLDQRTASADAPAIGSLSLGGAVAFEPSTGSFWYYDQRSAYFHVLVPGASETMFQCAGPVADLWGTSGGVYLVGGGAIQTQSAGGPVSPLLLDTVFYDLVNIPPLADGTAYLVDRGSDTAASSLYRFDPAASSVELLVTGFLTSASRGLLQDAFLSASEEPMICSSGGSIYRIADLQKGNRVPLAVPRTESIHDVSGDDTLDVLADVVDCGWDSQSGRFVILSQGIGVLYLSEDGTLETRYPAGEATLFRGVFFP